MSDVLYVAETPGNLLQPVSWFSKFASEPTQRVVQPPVLFLISNFRCVLNVVCFLLDNPPTSEFYTLTFRNTLSAPSSWAGRCEESHLPDYEDGTERSETSVYKIQTLGNYPEESIQHQVYVSSHVKKPRVGRQPLEEPESLSGEVNTSTSLDMSLPQNVHLVHPSSQTYS